MTADLFGYAPDPHANLLPADGIVNDYGVIFSPAEADACLKTLLHDIPWQHDEALIYGKHITTARQVAWYGDAGFAYRYSGVTRQAQAWTLFLLHLKHAVEQYLQAVSPTVFNSCLLNRYRNGQEGMAWHSDDEAELGRNTVIASLSFGAPPQICPAPPGKPTKARTDVATRPADCDARRNAALLAACDYEKQPC